MGPNQAPKPNTENTKYCSITPSMWWNHRASVTTFCPPWQLRTCRLSLGLVLILSRSIGKGFTRCLWLSLLTSHGLASPASGSLQFLRLHFHSFVPWPLGASLHGLWPVWPHLFSKNLLQASTAPRHSCSFWCLLKPVLCGQHGRFWLRAQDASVTPFTNSGVASRYLGS